MRGNKICPWLVVMASWLCCGMLYAAESPTDVLQHYPADTEGTPTPVVEALKKATLPPGFQMTCFASEPDVLQPIAINVDDRGRLWVAECFSYPQWAATGRDRLTILEDTNGDGKFDTRKIFWAEGNYLTGFQLGYGGVFVCCAPDILFIPDKNGDDIPDGPPEKVLTGWSTAGKHNVVNGLQWGPDGWLYGCNGITSPSRVGRPETPEKDRTPISCGIWRYHVRDKKFEVVCHGGTNPWGLDWNEEGEAFFTNCVIGHLFHVIPGARYQRMFGQDLNPYAYELMPWTSEHYHWQGGDWTKARGGKDNDELGGGHAHSGAIFLHGDQWPAEMRGDLLMCNIHGNRINRDHIERTSAGYVGKYRPDLIKFNDPWFRGVGFAAAPDGSIYVADWCDVGECHDYKEVHRNSGRIYKFWHGELKKWKPEDLEKAKKELGSTLLDSDPWAFRRMRQSLYELHSMPEEELYSAFMQAPLIIALNSKANSIKTRLRAAELMRAANIDYDGISRLKTGKSELRISQLSLVDQGSISFDVKALQFMEPREYRAVLSMLNRPAVKTSFEDLSLLLDHWQVIVSRYQIKPGSNDEKNLELLTYYAIEKRITGNEDTFIDLYEHFHSERVAQLFTRRILDINDKKALNKMTDLVLSKLTHANAKITAGSLIGMQQALQGVKFDKPPANWSVFVNRYRPLATPQSNATLNELSLLFGDSSIVLALYATVENINQPAAERQNALQLLTQYKFIGVAKLLPNLLNDSALRGHAIRALGAYQLADTPQLLLSKYDSFSLDEKLIAVETLAGRKAWASALLTAVSEKKIPRADVPIFIARQIQLHKDDALTKQLHDVWGTIKANNAAMTERKQHLKQTLTAEHLAKANTTNGATLFKNNCVQCHTLLGTGGKVGPDLTGAQRGNIDYLLENILDPSGVVARDYRLSVITLNDGRVLSGVIAEETGAVIKLRTTSGEVSLAKSDIDEQTQTNQSAMPEGLLDKLSGDEIRDLIGYLQTAK